MTDSAELKIDGFSLENILQIASLEKTSSSLEVRHEDQIGILDIVEGELSNADSGNLSGSEAAMEILCWDNVSMQLIELRKTERTIHASLINVLLEASKRKDERRSRNINSDTAQLQTAIRQAEEHQYKEAFRNLVPFLKQNRDNARGWIWYSRILGNTRAMHKALEKARELAPEDPVVKQELRKFKVVGDNLSSDKVHKCYFCWTPMDKEARVCDFCNSYLSVSRESLLNQSKADASYLHEAQERYSRVLKSDPRHISATYCLSLIQLNNGNIEEALGYLDRATKIAPDKASFASQLKLLMAYMAHNEQPTAEAEAELELIEAEQSDTKVQKTILVIEDSSTTRKVICIALARNGYRVVEAADGLEALSKISEERPDLIMLDVILPKMDGYKILSIIKGNTEFKDIPVIMLTSKDGFINKMKGKMAGSAAYLTKPFDPDEMIAEIHRHI